MKNPFQALLKAARMARKRSLSAARVLQQIALSPKPTRKRAKTGAKAAKRPPRVLISAEM
jgi:hypothetical protein